MLQVRACVDLSRLACAPSLITIAMKSLEGCAVLPYKDPDQMQYVRAFAHLSRL